MNRRSLLARSAFLIPFLKPAIGVKLEAQVSTDRNGNWWRDLTPVERVDYAIGFMDGMELGNRFSYWGMMYQDKDKQCSVKAVESYSSMSAKYLSSITSGQLTDGLNDFFSDYRNRSIFIYNAVYLVLLGIAGEPKDKLDKKIENFRKNVVPPSVPN